MLKGSRTVRASGVILFILLGQSPFSRAAATEDQREVARQSYARGLELAGEGNYEVALAAFKEAYRVSPHFAVLYNIGQAQVALGRPLEAIESLSKYLREGQEQVPRARREQAQAQIALLDSLFAELTITTDRPGARISVDNREVGRTPLYQQVRLPPGTHKISAAFDGSPAVIRSVTLGAGERQILSLEVPVSMTDPPVPAPSPAVRSGAAASPPSTGGNRHGPSESSTAGRRRPLSNAGYIAGAVGVALGGTALGLYLWNRDRYQDWQSNNAVLQSDKTAVGYYDGQIANNQLADSLTTANRAIAGLSVASGALLATGITLLVVDRVRAGKETSLAGRPGGVGLTLGGGWGGADRAPSVSWRGEW